MLTLTEHRQNVEDLIAQNRIDEARDYCRRLSHPNSRLWLSEINDLFPVEIGGASPLPYLQSDGEVAPEFLAKLNLVTDVMTDIDSPKSKYEPPYYPEPLLSTNHLLAFTIIAIQTAIIVLTVIYTEISEVLFVICFADLFIFIVTWMVLPESVKEELGAHQRFR